MNHLVGMIFIGLVVLAGCAAPTQRQAGDASSSDASAAESATQDNGAQSGSAASLPGGEAKSAADSRPLLTGPAAQKELQRIAMQSRILLNEGEEDKARDELEYAKRLDADNKEVACLLRSITADAASVFGNETTPYTVRPGDSLGSIAQRYMSGNCDFFLLARFNNIKVPKQLAVGQALRIPGRAVVTAPPVPSVAPATTTRQAPPKVEPTPVEQAAIKKPVPPPEPDPRVRQAEIDRTYRRGQEEYKRQNLGAAISAFDAVLRLDPNHNGARVLRQQAIELQAKLDTIKM